MPGARAVLAVLVFVPVMAFAEDDSPRREGHEAHAGPHMTQHLLDSSYRSPGLAVALSLTPLPVDFGNLYAESLDWGIAFTALELSTALPFMWLGFGHMCHGLSNDCGQWSVSERNLAIGLVSAYVVEKLIAGWHAGHAAREFNSRLLSP